MRGRSPRGNRGHTSTSLPAVPQPLPAVPETTPVPETASPALVTADRPICLALHGPVTLAVAGAKPARLERKQAALMAYLHHAGSTPRGRLAGLLWPEASASGARGNLRQCLARLRRIAPGALVEEDHGIVLAPAVVVDEPGDHRTALLEAYDYADCDDFSRWLREHIDAQRVARQAALMTALRAATQRGDFNEAQTRADALLALDRESEDAYRALMEVAYLRGDFAAAVRAWDRCGEMLRQFYGVAPSTATQALGAAILAAAPPATLPANAAVPALGPADTPALESHGVQTAVLLTRPSGPGNLGLTLPALYGRAADLASLLSTLHAHRLVTLIGIGGIGKTSLALAAAHVERERWPEGVWFVDIAPVREPENVAAAIAHVLGVGLSPHRPPTEELVRALRASAMLLVLDNAEHLWEALAGLTAALVAGTMHLRMLVTSRQALRVPQEQRFQLSGLSAPTDPDPTDLRQSGALALFEARVAALDPRFRLTAGNAAAIADVCRRLDGLPLAIELAAARVPLLGVEGLRIRLQQSLRVLGSGATVSAPRHQTLRATFDWTHALLTPSERTLLRRLAVFLGGFNLNLAEEVSSDTFDEPGAWPAGRARDAWSLLDDLSALIEKSLVVATDADPPRYRLLEVTRAYALEKLVEAGEFDRLSELHAHAIGRLFAEAEADLNEKTSGAVSRGQFLRRLTPELDNLRAARSWSKTSAPDQLLSVGLAAASTEALRLLGLSTEALRTMQDLRGVVDERMPAATVELFWTGLCALGTHGRLSRVETLEAVERAERLYRRVGSARRVHVGLYRKGFALLHLGDVDDAQRAVSEMESLERSDWPARAIVLRLNLKGVVDVSLGRFDASISAFRAATALLEFEPDERDVVLNVLSNLCMALLGAERYEEALSVAGDVLSGHPSPVVRNIAQRATMVALTFLGRLDEATAIARQAMSGWRSDDMLPHMLSVFAWLAYLQGRVADAIRLDGAAQAKVAHMGLSNTPVFARARTLLERAIADGAVPATDVLQWHSEGERLHDDEVVSLCVGERLGFGSRPYSASRRNLRGSIRRPRPATIGR